MKKIWLWTKNGLGSQWANSPPEALPSEKNNLSLRKKSRAPVKGFRGGKGSVCWLIEVDKKEKPPFNGFLTIEFLFTIKFTGPPINRTALGCAHMTTSSPEVTPIGLAQATGTVAAAAVLVYVVSLYCGAGYLDLPDQHEQGRPWDRLRDRHASLLQSVPSKRARS